jgi:hypothetical protein
MAQADAIGGSMPAHGRVRHARGAFVRRTRNAVLVLGNGEEPLVLRDNSVDLWDVLDEGRSMAQLAELVTAGFDVSEQRAMDDLVPFVDRLVAEGVLEAVEQPT